MIMRTKTPTIRSIKGIAGLEYQAEIPLMTFTRHTVYGLTLGVLVSKWFKSDSNKSNEKIMKIGGAEWSI